MLLLVAALMWSMGSELLIDIWQPHALLLPFCALVALTIAVACGDVMMLPVWVGVASLIVQTHVAYVYAVGALVVVVAVALALQLRARRGDEPWGSRRSPASCARTPSCGRSPCSSLAWIQPLWEQLFGTGEGNLQRLATHAGEGDLTVGGGTAVKIVVGGGGAAAVVDPRWVRGLDPQHAADRDRRTDRACSFPICRAGAVVGRGAARRGRLVDRVDRDAAARRSASGAHGMRRVARDARRRRRRAERAGGDRAPASAAIRCGGCSRCR